MIVEHLEPVERFLKRIRYILIALSVRFSTFDKSRYKWVVMAVSKSGHARGFILLFEKQLILINWAPCSELVRIGQNFTL